MSNVQGDIDIPFNEIVEEINFGLMAGTEVRYRRWGLMVDMAYADSRGSLLRTSVFFTTFDRIHFAEGDYEQKQFVGNFVLSYRFVDNSPIAFEGYAGARVNSLAAQITSFAQLLVGTPPFPVVKTEHRNNERWVDPVVGARFRLTISRPVFLRVGGDIGGFGVGSDLSWQASGVLGVDVTRNCSLALGYRGLGTDYSDGRFKYDVIAHGPMVGAEFRF
jgi:hypothetical protein